MSDLKKHSSESCILKRGQGQGNGTGEIPNTERQKCLSSLCFSQQVIYIQIFFKGSKYKKDAKPQLKSKFSPLPNIFLL